ncbi:cysteine hydrolase family protein [Sinomonas atrocyanea]|uniref:cysteine hydrolase family protein n=1 Tax=Sinomonas atrocyanea TaxID=37927 RepID=UPI00277EE186|nr:cysteine hydrolase [Sinomonas atrocyanea]MDQ0259486.1 nicotinamidase-related amidase [Sinomonas atrocyanea]MDR6623372.1 nicotinamidase-related amidase [Sinomonas atrocyanea]
MELDPTTTAVLAIHCQGDVISAEGAFAPFFFDEVWRRKVVQKVGDLLDAARAAGSTIVYTRVAFRPDYTDLVPNSPLLQGVVQGGSLKEGSPLAEIVEPLTPHPDDAVVTHQSVGGMTPELEALLAGRGIKTVLVAGVATNVSVESTARAAVDRGYQVFIVEDACSAATAAVHEAAVESMGLLAPSVQVADVARAFAPAHSA